MRTNEDIILSHLSQECGEITQIASKWYLFGSESYYPTDPDQTSNKRLLAREVGNLLAVIEHLNLPEDEVEYGRKEKEKRLQKQLTVDG